MFIFGQFRCDFVSIKRKSSIPGKVLWTAIRNASVGKTARSHVLTGFPDKVSHFLHKIQV